MFIGNNYPFTSRGTYRRLCEACPYNATASLQHFLLEYPAYQNIRDQSFQKIVDHMNAAMPCLDFTELSPLQFLLVILTLTTEILQH
jgi:hypothetical protein